MKKITGKVVSLVLALALVVTSFSSTFAFAATKTETGTATVDSGTIYLSNGGTTAATQSVDLNTWLGSNYSLKTYDHSTVADAALAQVAHSSGDSLVKVTKTTSGSQDVFTLTLKNPSTAKGTEVLSLLFTGTTPRGDDTYTVRGTTTITINVVAKGTAYITEDTSVDEGSVPSAVGNFYKNDNTGKTISVFVANVGSSALAHYGVAATTQDSTATGTTAAYQLKATGNLALNGSVYKLTSAASVGNALRITAYAKNTAGNAYSTTSAAVANFKVENTYKGAYTAIAKGDGSTVTAGTILNSTAATVLSKSKTYAKSGSNYTDVTGANVVVDGAATAPTVESGKIGNLTVKDSGATINGGTVGDVVAEAGNVSVADGTVSSIKAQSSDGNTNYDVTVTGGTVGPIKNADQVTVNGGKVGDIKATIVTVDPAADDTPASVGKVSAKDLTVDASNAAAAAGAFTATDAGTVSLAGKASVSSLDFDYYATNLTFNGFTGSVAAPAKATNATISSNNDDTNAKVTGNVSVDTIDISEGTVSFTDSVKVGTVTGAGTLVVNAGKLLVTDAIEGSVVLKLADAATVKPGTVVYQAATGISDVDSFAPYGFTLKVVTGTTNDTFVIDKVSFAGLTIDKPDTSIVVNKSVTFTASAYPAATTLPAGYAVQWDFDGADDFFTTSTNGNSITITATKYDGTFTSLNSGTLKATVVDQYGIEDTTYGSASITVSSTNKPAFTSDTTKDFAVAAGASYTFKITSDTAPVVTLGTPGVFTMAPAVKNGNNYLVKITATGKVGSATGVFINGQKLLVASVKASFTSDTNVAVKVAAGKSYTYKITAAAAPSFGFGTNGVFTVSKITNSGTNYFFTITATGKSGAATGVFVNGVKVNVATVA